MDRLHSRYADIFKTAEAKAQTIAGEMQSSARASMQIRSGVHNNWPPFCFERPASGAMIDRRHASSTAGAACDAQINKLSIARRQARKHRVKSQQNFRFVVQRMHV